jgi:aldose 1-epimerase
MALTGEQFRITAGDHEATLVAIGAGLRGYSFRGIEITPTYGEGLPPKGCGTTLVPWPNRLRGGAYTFDGVKQQTALTEPAVGNAIHGLGRWARWAPVTTARSAPAPNKITLGLDIPPQNGYPYEVRAEVTYALDVQYGLTVTLRAINTGSARAPFGAGSHPYLTTRGTALDDVRLIVPATRRLITDERRIPVDEVDVTGTLYDLRTPKPLAGRRFDDGFTGLDPSEGKGRYEALVVSDAGSTRVWFDPDFGYVQVFTVESLVGGQPAIAIEPMTCPADAFNSGTGLIVLEAGQEWSASWGIEPLESL